jgi:hypothetical protein
MSTSAPAQRLHDFTEHGQSSGTAPAVAMADLGTAEEVAAHAHELAVHPLAPIAAEAIAAAGAAGDPALLAFAAALPAQPSLLALHDACDVLLGHPRAVEVAGAVLHDALLPSAQERVSQPLLAAARLEASLRLTLLGARPPWKVLAALTEDVTAMPEEHRDRLARLIGVFLDTQDPAAGRADLLSQLERLCELDADDALAELGAQALRDAVSLADPGLVRPAVIGAAELLDRAAERDGGREDCAALAACARAVVAFADRDAAAVRASAGLALAASEALALDLRGMHQRAWTAPRRGAQAGWLSLAAALDASAAELEHDAFLDTSEAVVALGEAYGDIRTVSPAGQAAARLARPRIEVDVALRTAMLAQVERAVALDAGRDRPLLPAGAAQLLAAVRGRAAAPAAADGDDPAEPDPAGSGTAPGALAEVVGAPHADALLGEHPRARRALDDLAALVRDDDLLSLLADRDPALVLLEERLLADLEANEYFTGHARQDFWRLTRLTVRFVQRTLDQAAPYLRPFGDRANAPHERALQEHYAAWLALVMPRVHTEVRDLGSGRCDVLVVMRHGSEFAVEIKRELADASRGAIEADYLGQALEYQGARLPLGGLLVLDLTAHGTVTPHVADLLWVAHRSPAGGAVLRTALCGVVVGNRPPPSQVTARPP